MQATQVFISLLPLLLAAIFVLAGLVLLVRGIRGEPDLSHPSCGKCTYDLRGRDLAATGAACPECGAALAAPRAVNYGKYRRRPVMALIGGAMVILPIVAIAAIAFLAVSQVQRIAAVGGVPAVGPFGARAQTNAQLIQGLATAANQPWNWDELIARHGRGELSDEEIVAAIDQLIAFLQAATGPQSGTTVWAQNFLQLALDSGAVTPAQKATLAQAYYGNTPPVRIRQRLRTGQMAYFMMHGALGQDLPGVQALSALTSVTIGDRELVITDGQFKERMLSSAGSIGPSGFIKAIDAEPGEHVINFTVEWGAMEGQPNEFGPHRPPGPPDRWPATLARWSHTMAVPIVVVKADEAIIEEVIDTRLRQTVRDSLRVRHVEITPRNNQFQLTVDMGFERSPVVPLSFDLVMRYDDKEVAIGSFWVAAVNGGHTSSVGTTTYLRSDLPAHVERVQIVFRPNAQKVETYADIDRIWGEEVVFDDVPVVRE